jgi:hypothetical protein
MPLANIGLTQIMDLTRREVSKNNILDRM